MAGNKQKLIKYLVLDVDGVFTTGQFLYTSEGKFSKVFGAHDSDGIKLIKNYLEIRTITADKRGLPITKKRIYEDMGLPLDLVPEEERKDWFRKNVDLKQTIFMGDGIFDSKIFDIVAYGIAPHNAFYIAKQKADFITKHNSGEGAVAEACIHILNRFFNIHDY